MSYKFIFICLFIIAFSDVSSQQIEMPFYYVDLECSFNTNSNKFIFNEKTELYQASNCRFVTIDFSEYSLIAVQGFTGGCQLPEVEFKVIRDISDKQYYIEAIVYQFGSCRRYNGYRKAICLEKLEKNYKVDFEIRQVNIY